LTTSINIELCQQGIFEMIAYSLGLLLAPTLVGFFLALGVIRYALEMKLIRQLKIISYVLALIFSTVIHIEFFPLTSSANVVFGTLLGFIIPIFLAMLMKRIQKAKQADEI
jgi:hypothetical protein